MRQVRPVRLTSRKSWYIEQKKAEIAEIHTRFAHSPVAFFATFCSHEYKETRGRSDHTNE